MEQYPEKGAFVIKNAKTNKDSYPDFLKIYNVNYNVAFYFLPYNFQYSEEVSGDFKSEAVPLSISYIVQNQAIKRIINLSFQVRQKNNDNITPMNLDGDEILHTLDHFKRTIWPNYSKDENGAIVPGTLSTFVIQYKNLIGDGENSFELGATNGTSGNIVTFKMDPVMDGPNKLAFYPEKNFVYPKVFNISIGLHVSDPNTILYKSSGRLANRHFFYYDHTHKHENNLSDLDEKESEKAGQESSNSDTGGFSRREKASASGGARGAPAGGARE
jgi:hypothetical protein